jgi:LPS sulfotransferase NodH
LVNQKINAAAKLLKLPQRLDVNSHLIELISGLGPLKTESGFIPPDLNFLFILFTNRCGSNYFSQAISSTGYFNEAGEFFNSSTILSHTRANNLQSLHEYFCFLPHLVALNGWLVAKLAPENIEILTEAGILEAVLERSRFILLERQDRLGQAISRTIASQNLQWTSEHDSRIPQGRLVYCRDRIDQESGTIGRANGFLYRFLASNRISPLHFAYEALTARPEQHVDEVARWLGYPRLRLDPTRIRLRRQAGAVNDAWRKRYLKGC